VVRGGGQQWQRQRGARGRRVVERREEDEDFVRRFENIYIIEAVSCIGAWWAGSWAELDGFGPGKFFFSLFPLFLLSVSCFWDSNLILKSFMQEFGFRF
jgi:hypothetical protein